MKIYQKRNFSVTNIRRLLEPGPVVLISSAYKDQTNIMTMGWHTVMLFSPSLIGCYIWPGNHSYEMIRKSKSCVINIPTLDLVNQVVGIGNTSGDELDKFAHFKLTPLAGKKVSAPLIKECYANFECKVIDTTFLKKYSFFILEVLKAHVAISPKYPQTLHYRGEGIFMVSGKNINLRRKFKPENL